VGWLTVRGGVIDGCRHRDLPTSAQVVSKLGLSDDLELIEAHIATTAAVKSGFAIA